MNGMNIPKSVRINGVEYAVLQDCKNLNDGIHCLRGQICYRKCTIELAEGLAHQTACMTLIHEILHGIVEASGQAIEEEESVIELFARGLYQVLQDNGERLFDLEIKEVG